MAVLAVLCALLAASSLALGVLVVRLRRERRAALVLLGGDSDGDLSAAVARDRGRVVPKEELAALVASREAILEASPLPVLIFDERATAVRANRAARTTFPGFGPGQPAAELGAGLAEALAQVAATGAALDTELVLDRPDRRTFEAHLRPHVDGSGRSAVAVLADVTGFVDFREARRLFSAAVSHELRTPLARILGLAETMALPQSHDERESLVPQIEVEIDNMRRLVDEMLLLASLDRGGTAITEAVADAGHVAEGVVADRRSRRAQRDRTLEATAVARLFVPVAPPLLEVVIGNLVDNALRHAGPDAAVTVGVHGRGGEVEIVVTDTGVGILPEHVPHVFERFYRGEASRSGPGSGLGLAIVKHVVEAHRGRATVDSRPGQGTTVRIVLPKAAGRR